MFKKLRTVIYHTNDLEAARDWYMKATGLHPYFDTSFYVGFDINGCELGLDPDPKYVTNGNHAVSYWSVDDIDDAMHHLLDLGAVIHEPLRDVGSGIQVVVLNDPFGNAIGLIHGA